MVMDLIQVRIPDGLTDQINILVTKGYYASKSDVIRDAIRRLVLEKQVGSIQNKGDSVQEIRVLRRKLSKQELNLEEINKL